MPLVEIDSTIAPASLAIITPAAISQLLRLRSQWEVTNDSLSEHLSATGLEGVIAVVACDKPPVGTLAAILEHNRPAILMSDGSIRPGVDSETGERMRELKLDL